MPIGENVLHVQYVLHAHYTGTERKPVKLRISCTIKSFLVTWSSTKKALTKSFCQCFQEVILAIVDSRIQMKCNGCKVKGVTCRYMWIELQPWDAHLPVIAFYEENNWNNSFIVVKSIIIFAQHYVLVGFDPTFKFQSKKTLVIS